MSDVVLNNWGVSLSIETLTDKAYAQSILRETDTSLVLLVSLDNISDATLLALEEAITPLLPTSTRAKLANISHTSRQRQSRWGRILAFARAQALGLVMTEVLPYSPVLTNKDGRRMKTMAISHSAALIGLADDTAPIGIDIEVPRAIRDVSAMSDMAFGPYVAALAQKVTQEYQSLIPFFALWGMKESETKMNRGTKRFLLTLEETTDKPIVIDSDAALDVKAYFSEWHEARITVLATTRPTLYSITPQCLADIILTHSH